MLTWKCNVTLHFFYRCNVLEYVALAWECPNRDENFKIGTHQWTIYCNPCQCFSKHGYVCACISDVPVFTTLALWIFMNHYNHFESLCKAGVYCFIPSVAQKSICGKFFTGLWRNMKMAVPALARPFSPDVQCQYFRLCRCTGPKECI